MSKPHKNYALDPKPLGTGGQAEVFRARDKRTNLIVALKRLMRSSRNDADAIARMRREIDVQTVVQHRNVMPVFDHSELFYWYTMPVASEILGNMSAPVVDEVLFQVIEDCANGLLVAHEQGYVHRDLTPNNILYINEDGDSRWVVSDWGLVRRHGQTTVVRTAPGQQFGTAGFSAPETWSDAHAVDKRADVYSLGRVVAWCLTGQWPSPNIPFLPGGKWNEFVRLTTILNPDQRIQNMEDVLNFTKTMKAPTKTTKVPSSIISKTSLSGLAQAATITDLEDIDNRLAPELENILKVTCLAEKNNRDGVLHLIGPDHMKTLGIETDARIRVRQFRQLDNDGYIQDLTKGVNVIYYDIRLTEKGRSYCEKYNLN